MNDSDSKKPKKLMLYANEIDVQFMKRALVLAREAAENGEVPVGAVLVLSTPDVESISVNRIVGVGKNRRESGADPLGHAELLAIAEGAATLGRWRLSDCTLYVTLEPCVMCAGALVQSRIGRLVYGAQDLKGGAIASLYSLASDARLNHQLEITSGVCESECSELLTEFFVQLRLQKKHGKPSKG